MKTRNLLPTLAACVLFGLTILPLARLRTERLQRERDNALIAAIKSKNTPAALNLLQHGASPDARESLLPGPTLFQSLSRIWHTESSCKRVCGPPALQLAVEQDLVPVIKELLLRHAQDINTHVQEIGFNGLPEMDEKGQALTSALVILVAQKKHFDLAWMFIHLGAAQTKDDKEALLCAADADITRYLIDRGTDANGGATFDNGYPNKPVPLIRAIVNNDFVKSRLLLEHGARAEVKSGGLESTMHTAAENGDIAMLRLLLAHGASADVSVKMGTPLCSAAENNHLEVVKILLSAGADARYSGYGGSVLTHALEAEEYAEGDKQPFQKQTQEQIIALLLKHHADANFEYKQYYLLPWVAKMGRMRIAEMMLASGADVNVVNRDGSTALSRAVEENHLDMARLLLRHGARMRYAADREDWVAAEDGKPQHLTIDLRQHAKTAAMRCLLKRYR